MYNQAKIVPFVANTTVSGRTIVQVTSADKQVSPADASSNILGVSAELDKVAGEVVDVIVDGVAEVKAGGTITRGDFLTADANGNAITLTDALMQGGRKYVLGLALDSGVSGDYISVLVAPSVTGKATT